METVQKNFNKIRVPDQSAKVYKDECLFCFDSPESEGGLFVCMNRFWGFCRRHVEMYSQKTGNAVFLHLKKIKKKLDKAGVPPAEKVSRLAIGVEGGFNPEAAAAKNYELEDRNCIVVLPNFERISLDEKNLPMIVQMSVDAILKAESASRKQELADAAGTWDGEILQISKFAENLTQLDNGVKIHPKGWKCERCDLTNNLWLNLTSGAILCGRKFFDGSGGNNHAVEYYKETNYPLAVKLGTITKEGKADVFSYPEDNMVEDPYLAKHLVHFGINILNMEKTDKSMVELEIDMNQRIGEWATLTESGSKLKPVYGPGHTGLVNLGNTCYLNSVIQVLFSIPEFVKVYVEGAESVFNSFDVGGGRDPSDDLDLHFCKLGCGLLSGDYSKEPEEPSDDNDENQPGIKPVMFKNLIGKGHPEFSGKQQQDAQEFYLHLLTCLERKSKIPKKAGHVLQFEVEDRVECGSSGQVKYLTRIEDYLPLPIPMASATNLEEVAAYEAKKKADPKLKDDVVRPKIPFRSCIQEFCLTEEIPDFYSSAIKGVTKAKKTMRLKTFPDYLFIQLKKFDVDKNWVPYKLDVEVEMPEEIDLSDLATKGGLQDGEIEMPDEPPEEEEENQRQQQQQNIIVPDVAIVNQLRDMGFSTEGCKKAAWHTKNAGVEAAMNWVMEHMGDPDFNDPFVDPSAPKKAQKAPDEEHIAMVMSMGFSLGQATKALKSTDDNVERAIEWIFNHPDDIGEGGDGEDKPENKKSKKTNLTNGEPKYKLIGFISHMGTSHLVGHYVCHLLKNDKWVIFNDNKVALSENPPKGLGYLYLYERISNKN